MKENSDLEIRLAKCDKVVKAGDFLSLLAFVGVWYFYDIFEATKALMAVMLPISIAAFVWYRAAPRMQVFMVVTVVIFGTLTLYFNDAAFIKVRPTITFTAFAVGAFVSVFINKPFIALLIPPQVFAESGLSQEALHPLMRNFSVRMGFLFVFLAVMNEIVWRTQSEDFWVLYRLFGSMGFTFLFFALHIPWFIKELKKLESTGGATGQGGHAQLQKAMMNFLQKKESE